MKLKTPLQACVYRHIARCVFTTILSTHTQSSDNIICTNLSLRQKKAAESSQLHVKSMSCAWSLVRRKDANRFTIIIFELTVRRRMHFVFLNSISKVSVSLLPSLLARSKAGKGKRSRSMTRYGRELMPP